jgi:hypothetical protein
MFMKLSWIGHDTVHSSRSAAKGNPTAVRISPKTTGGRAIDVDFTPKQSNRLSLVSASAATRKMLRSGSSGPQSEMAEYYKSRAEIDRIRHTHEFELNEGKLRLEQARFDREEWKEQVERKRLKADENKSLIAAYAEISKLNFETMKMRAKMKEESEMSEEDIAKVFPLLEYPPKPSWEA